MPKVIFIRSLGEHNKADCFRTNIPEPLSLEYFQALLEQINVESSIYYGKIDETELFEELLSDSVIAVCFSVYTYQYQYSLELARKIKSIKMNSQNVESLERNNVNHTSISACKGNDFLSPTIIFGGYHPSAQPEIVIQEDAVDIVVQGEGEITIFKIIKSLLNKEDLSKVKGIWYKDINGTLIKTNAQERILELDKLPFPKRNKRFLVNSNLYQIIYPPISQQKSVVQVIYSRGCPFACVFCSSKNMWGEEVVWRAPQKVLDEIEYLYNEYGTNLVFFPDLTFNLDKNKVIEICNEFVRRDLPVHWSAFFRIDRLDEEILFAIHEAKCTKMYLGLETDSINADNLKGNYKITEDTYYKLLQKASDINLLIRAFLIIGFPSDTTEKIRNYNNFLRSLAIDEIIVSFITPFPGTQIWDEYSRYNLLKDYDFVEFTTDIPIISHPILTKKQLLDLRLEVVQNFYLESSYKERILGKVTRYPHLQNSYFEYFEFLENKGIIDNGQLTSMFK